MRHPLFDARHYTSDEVKGLTRRQINAAFRSVDESHLYPVLGRFNVTERAINRLKRLVRQGLEPSEGYQYCLELEREISNIVNSI